MLIRRLPWIALGCVLARVMWPAPSSHERAPVAVKAPPAPARAPVARAEPAAVPSVIPTFEGAIESGTRRDDAFVHIYDRSHEIAARAALLVIRDGSGEPRKLALSRLEGIIVTGAVPKLDTLLLHVPPIRELERPLIERFEKQATPALAMVLGRIGGLEAKRALRDMLSARDPNLVATIAVILGAGAPRRDATAGG